MYIAALPISPVCIALAVDLTAFDGRYIDCIFKYVRRPQPFTPCINMGTSHVSFMVPDSKVGANMGPVWRRLDPGGPHFGPLNFAIWGDVVVQYK